MKNASIIIRQTSDKMAYVPRINPLWIVFITLFISVFPLGASTYNWGAFRVQTEPSGAIVRALGTFEYLGESPTEPFAFTMDRYMGYNGFAAGRWFDLEISKAGYQTQYSRIFVPFTEKYEDFAQKRPKVFMFTLRPLPTYKPYYVPPVYPPYPYYHHNQPGSPYHKNTVEITSDPRGVSVYIDGDYYGQTPLKVNLYWILGVNGDKVVVFEKSGYESNQKILGPFQKNLHAVLQPRGQRRY
ncbi:MAG: PEGA domain-containing protein [Candidatus Cloacimonetes bacterium]|nr:PEGA domain-containing protein [Candidatus Cloacimonadota bacterium]